MRTNPNEGFSRNFARLKSVPSFPPGHNMSVMGSQLEIDMDPDGDLTVVPRHTGQTGTGCYRLHDHQIYDPHLGRQGPLYGNDPRVPPFDGGGGGVDDDRPRKPPDNNNGVDRNGGQPQTLEGVTQVAPPPGGPGNGEAGWSGTGPGPPPGTQTQPHLLDMPLQPPTPYSSRQKVLKQLNAPSQKSMVGQKCLVSSKPCGM